MKLIDRIRHKHTSWTVTHFRYKKLSGGFTYTGFYPDYYLAMATTGISELTERCSCGKVRADRYVEGRYRSHDER